MIVNVIPSETQKLLYSVEASASLLGISRSTLYLQIQSRDIKAVKINNRTLIPHSSLIRYVARLEERANEGQNARLGRVR